MSTFLAGRSAGRSRTGSRRGSSAALAARRARPCGSCSGWRCAFRVVAADDQHVPFHRPLPLRLGRPRAGARDQPLPLRPRRRAPHALRDGGIYAHINRSNYAKTVYPPGSQMVFLLVTRLSETRHGHAPDDGVLRGAGGVAARAARSPPTGCPRNARCSTRGIRCASGNSRAAGIRTRSCSRAWRWRLLMHRRGREMATGVALGLRGADETVSAHPVPGAVPEIPLGLADAAGAARRRFARATRPIR